ncbi:MAG: hypothetical protein IPM54_25380 [Polyangiaceae bacterium]|nr:hypothetical protein [Polyangiaceae bacterium]
MLKALLHRKLPRSIVESDDAAGAENFAHVEPTRREDPLTASIFERLAYLPASLTWEILRRATKALADGSALPVHAPSGAPIWSFWPSLRPGADGVNRQRVEPDVLVSWVDTLLVVEAKHYGDQRANQWVEQIRAVRVMPEHSGKRIWLIAVGGNVSREQEAQAAHVRRALSNASPGLLALRWEDLHHAIDDFRISSRAPEQSAVLNDIAAALDAWGYRKKTWFSSLRAIGPSIQSEKAMAALQAWRVR